VFGLVGAGLVPVGGERRRALATGPAAPTPAAAAPATPGLAARLTLGGDRGRGGGGAVILGRALLGGRTLLGRGDRRNLGWHLGITQQTEHARFDPNERAARRLFNGGGQLRLHGHLGCATDEGEQLFPHRAFGKLLVVQGLAFALED